MAEANIRKEAEKWKLVEKENKKKQLEYLKQLCNKILAKDATLLGGTEGFQIMRSKYKKVISENKKR